MKIFFITSMLLISAPSDLIATLPTSHRAEFKNCPVVVDLIRKEKYAHAFKFSQGKKCAVLREIALWKMLRMDHRVLKGAEKDDILKHGFKFLKDNPDLPARKNLIAALATAIHEDMPKDLMQAYLDQGGPLNIELLFAIKKNLGQNAFKQHLRDFFIHSYIPPKDFQLIFEKYRDLLHISHFDKRLKYAQERGDLSTLSQTIKSHPGKVAQRYLLQEKLLQGGHDPLVLYNKFEKSGALDSQIAACLLKDALRSEKDSVFKVLWGRAQKFITPDLVRFQPFIIIAARDALKAKKYKRADDLLAQLKNDKSVSYFEAKLLQALNLYFYLKDTVKAREILESRLPGIGLAPLRARYAYWIARFYENEPKVRLGWLERAAHHQKTYYGQCAQFDLGRPLEISFEKGVPARKSPLLRHPLAIRAHFLKELGCLEDLSLMLYKLYSLTPVEKKQGFIDLIRGHFKGYWIEFMALERQEIKSQEFYPELAQLNLKDYKGISREPLFRAIVRKESCFNPGAVSGVGALGCAQMMLTTAQIISDNKALKRQALLQDPALNLRIGSLYIENLLERYEGDAVLALVAYNAGMLHAENWLAAFGDPRRGEIDRNLWLELIPYRETRWYIMLVLASAEVYHYLDMKARPLGYSKVMHVAHGRAF